MLATIQSSRLQPKNVKIRIHKTIRIILHVFLYGCEIWSLILREEHRLRVFENRVLRRIFGSEKGEVIGGWRKLHNEELLTCTRIIRMIKSRRMRWGGHVARTVERKGMHIEYWWESQKERKIPLG
jgi:hypothetical protein